MRNNFREHENGVIVIEANGESKLGLHIVINEQRLELVDSATSSYWRIIKDKNMYYAVADNHDKLIYMHDLITRSKERTCEERFIRYRGKNHLVPNINKGMKVKRAIRDGLFNVDDNLMIGKVPILTDDLKYLHEDYSTPIIQELTDEDLYRKDILDLINSDDERKAIGIEDIIQSLNSIIKHPLFRRMYGDTSYQQLLNNLLSGKYDYDIIKQCLVSLEDLETMSNDLSYDHESEFLFPGHLLVVYPSVVNTKANRMHLCIFSGARISPGSVHCVYRLFIDDVTTKNRYALKYPLHAEIGCESLFPHTVKELDDFSYRLEHAYDMDFTDYYNIACNIGSDGLPLVKLKRK